MHLPRPSGPENRCTPIGVDIPLKRTTSVRASSTPLLSPPAHTLAAPPSCPFLLHLSSSNSRYATSNGPLSTSRHTFTPSSSAVWVR
ncbi:hypothetical protein GMOD_00006365 [Pyrenophora seminiperda CCB06]|uniref:Uncharacterized protein n=1 Tax=Pyrenophora seminiperda CCB06 TaxID=1302712 RepID=A0A3M7M4W2_9PLEO|nr:hypothetical protein GMOD_00006365 [Pyrenophora seminiperda CCB06]